MTGIKHFIAIVHFRLWRKYYLDCKLAASAKHNSDHLHCLYCFNCFYSSIGQG